MNVEVSTTHYWEGEGAAPAGWAPTVTTASYPACVACYGDFIRAGTITASFGPTDAGPATTDCWCPTHFAETVQEFGYALVVAHRTPEV